MSGNFVHRKREQCTKLPDIFGPPMIYHVSLIANQATKSSSKFPVIIYALLEKRLRINAKYMSNISTNNF